MKFKNKKKFKFVISFCLLFAVLITGILAFMTASDTKTNTFTVGKVKIELWEDFDSDGDDITEVYNADYQQVEMDSEYNVIPRRIVQHAPYVKNVGKNDAYIYLVAAVPIHEVVMQGETDLTPQQMFYLQDSEGDNILSRDIDTQESVKWVYMSNFDTMPWDFDEGIDETNNEYKYYLFKYLDVTSPGDTTNVLFNQTQTIDYTNFTTEEEVNNNGINIDDCSYIKLYAFGIQVEGFNSSEEAWCTFCPVMHKITFNTGDGTSSVPDAYYFEGANINNLDRNPTREHYYLTGWTLTDKNNSAFSDSTMPSFDLTATALWNKMPSVIFDTDGGSVVNPIEAIPGTVITQPEAPVKEGYTFDGWNAEFPSVMPANDIHLIAEWQANTYVLTTDFNNGYNAFTENIVYATDLDTATQSQLLISGPYPETQHPYNDNSNIDCGTITAPSMAESIVIKFSQDSQTETNYDYVAVYDKNDNLIFNSMSNGYFGGTTITVPGNIAKFRFHSDGSARYYGFAIDSAYAVLSGEKEGYTFTGWKYYNTSTGEEIATPVTMPAFDVTRVAQWTPN